MEQSASFLACSHCFTYRGLHLDAEQIGIEDASVCPNCGSTIGRKLSEAGVQALAHRFFVWGSLVRCEYGAALVIRFNEHQTTSTKVLPWLQKVLSKLS